ncbi:hypothetical protein PHYSODRAFT_484392 [Phytophthora sojae]|uniref:FYVE-type domain-containing protein n=1 Tax=Phytophthora sojae (strain P6497) TaxID=1094619 RepID=G4YXH0_PHYSP|nr:hypothetical protein PHYSODRAFT_484392 [Phytophthora sojae]EGZ23831.1 hypothetical protein PHYSODRAFT_484392 [Phytophthora sojae]|eukprot:XP_009519119.1 hypothetical protein PHYSODRAFT_484392 [Phytophthora sojae]
MSLAEDAVLLDKSPFPPLQLSYEEQQHCHDVSLQLLERVLRSYDERLAGITPRHHANLDSARWKLEKTQENASMYTERIRHVRSDLHLPDDVWEDPIVLMMAGNIAAPLDEVMFGLAIPTIEAFKIRVSTLGNQDLGGAILAKLVGPTEEKPFQNLSVLYMTTELPWLVSKVVRPRDFVLLSASGVVTTAAGERIGYDLLQPAPLPQCGPLPKPMIRGKYVFGALYRQLEDGTVDVYVQQYLEAMGNIFDSYAISSAWQGILGFFSAPVLSEHKKLQWCIAHMRSARRRGMTLDSAADRRTCVLCLAPVCVNCREERVYKVVERHPRKKVLSTRKKEVFVCRPCLDFVQRHKPADIARYSINDQLTPSSDSSRDTNGSGPVTWGLLYGDSVPEWSPTRSLSVSSQSFDSFSWNPEP